MFYIVESFPRSPHVQHEPSNVVIKRGRIIHLHWLRSWEKNNNFFSRAARSIRPAGIKSLARSSKPPGGKRKFFSMQTVRAGSLSLSVAGLILDFCL